MTTMTTMTKKMKTMTMMINDDDEGDDDDDKVDDKDDDKDDDLVTWSPSLPLRSLASLMRKMSPLPASSRLAVRHSSIFCWCLFSDCTQGKVISNK